MIVTLVLSSLPTRYRDTFLRHGLFVSLAGPLWEDRPNVTLLAQSENLTHLAFGL